MPATVWNSKDGDSESDDDSDDESNESESDSGEEDDSSDTNADDGDEEEDGTKVNSMGTSANPLNASASGSLSRSAIWSATCTGAS